MKYYIFVMLFLLMTINTVYAQFSQVEKQQIENSTADREEKLVEKKNKRIKKIRWPAKFIPSEKINADSSVAFPVDI